MLNQVYIREVPVLLCKIDERRRNKALEKLIDHQFRFRLSLATAGLQPDRDLIEGLAKDLDRQQDFLLGSRKEEEPTIEESDIDKWYAEWEALEQEEEKTNKDLARMAELKSMMNQHIDNEIGKLKGLNSQQRQLKLGQARKG